VLVRDLKVMDTSAIALAREIQIPILVFSINNKDSIAQAAMGKGKFTLITDKK
jgi:uridylate kinase